jgi:hypothetical protein
VAQVQRRAIGAMMLLLTLGQPQAARSTSAEQLYRATAIVTGRRAETRDPAVVQGFQEVLAKVSGDARLLDDPVAAAQALRRAGSAVRSVSYRDRMAHLPVHDEQGTSDRPYDVTIDFDPDAVDAVLAALGRRPWGPDRPRVAVLVTWRFGTDAGVLTAEGERGRTRREALAAASERVALPVAVPAPGAWEAAGLGLEQLADAGAAGLVSLAHAVGGDVALAGTMVFSDAELGWTTVWRLVRPEGEARWRVAGVSFDEAFRNGLRGAARILSGHGAPG